MIFNLSTQNTIVNTFVSELRHIHIQKDSMRFRRNLERIGEYFALEISKGLAYELQEVETPLGTAQCKLLTEQPVLATILRAGLPLQNGLLNIFDRANCTFISAYRKHKKSGEFVIQMEYISSPNLDARTVIICDPMLATGQSMVMCCKALLANYNIKELHIVAAIASAEGVAHVRANLPQAKLWLGAIDEEMTTKSYIVPGLGDAGDLAYGEKL